MPIKTPRRPMAAALLIAIATFPLPAFAMPSGISYQAYLTSADGTAIDGDVTVTFSLYNVPTGGVPLWGQTDTLGIEQGLLTATLSDTGNPFPVGLFDGPIFVGVFIDGEEMLPRRALGATAFAYKAGDAETLSGVPAASLDQSAQVAALEGDLTLLDARVTTIEDAEPVQLIGVGATTVSGSFPSFTISSTDNVDDADASATNELQTLSLAGSNLSVLPAGGTVSLANFKSPWIDVAGNLFFSSGNVGLGDSSPVATLTVGAGDKFQVRGSDGGVRLLDDQATIQFPATSGDNAPMMQMFSSGTSNSTRMVLAHSTPFSDWGLQYRDDIDAFDWIGDGLPVMRLNLNGDRRIGVGTFEPEAKVHILANSGAATGQIKLTETESDFSRITFDNTVGTDYWELAARASSTPSSADINFFHSEGGNILSIDSRGYVGVNDATPTYPLDVVGEGATRTINVRNTAATTGGSVNNYGVISILNQAINTGFPRLYGLYGASTDPDSFITYGVFGQATNATSANYGVYGTAPTTANSYAVYAQGNVFSTGSYLPSDAMLKTGVRSLERGMDALMALRPRAYTYDNERFGFMNLPSETQFGFVAQEFEASFPDLVKTTFQPYDEAVGDTRDGQGVEFKAINYTGLIPVIVSALQEQQRTIDQQDATIRALEERLSALEAKLGQ